MGSFRSILILPSRVTKTSVSMVFMLASLLDGPKGRNKGKSPASGREPLRGEERELKEIVGVCDSGTGPTPEPRPAKYNSRGIWGIPIFKFMD